MSVCTHCLQHYNCDTSNNLPLLRSVMGGGGGGGDLIGFVFIVIQTGILLSSQLFNEHIKTCCYSPGIPWTQSRA